MACSICVNTHSISCGSNVIKQQINLCKLWNTKTKDLYADVLKELCYNTATVISKDLINLFLLKYNGIELKKPDKLEAVKTIYSPNDLFLNLELSNYKLQPICIKIKDSNNQFIVLNNSTIQTIKKFISKYIKVGELYYNDTQLTSTENINKTLIQCGCYNYDINLLENKIILPKTKKVNKIIDNSNTVDKKNTINSSKKNKKTISASKKRDVWYTYIGKDVGSSKCLCCKNEEIIQINFHCGHIISEKDGGTLNIDNLRPICSKCNLSMGSENMNEFMIRNKYTTQL